MLNDKYVKYVLKQSQFKMTAEEDLIRYIVWIKEWETNLNAQSSPKESMCHVQKIAMIFKWNK